MANEILLYAGSITILAWGIGHIIPTRSVVSGFGELSADNKRIITMEWIAEGLALCFLGALVLVVTLVGGGNASVSTAVYAMSGALLIVMAGLSAATGARTSITPIKICPAIKTAVAILFFLGILL